MTRRLTLFAATLLVAAIVTGCAESATPQATGKGNIRGVNAIATAPVVSFLIEERELATVNFKRVTAFSAFDDLTFDFNFDLSLPNQFERTRLATQSIDVQADHQYTVVLTGSIASPSTLFWEDPAREWEGTETVLEISFAHLAPSLGEFDVYFAAPGSVPVPGQAIGSLTNGERLPIMEFEDGQYELILTAKDDPATVIYQSELLDTAPRTRSTLAIFDPDPTVPAGVAVRLLNSSGGSFALGDINFPSQVRTLHASFGVENFDGYFDGDFASTVYSDIGFKELSPYADIPDNTALLTLTPVGNIGATIHEDDIVVPGNTKNTVVLVGEPGNAVFLNMVDNARPLETFPVIRFINASVNTGVLDIYMVEPGTPLEDVSIPQLAGLPSLITTGFRSAPEGMVEVTVTLSGEKTPVATSLLLDLADGDRADVLIADTADPAMLELVLFEFQAGP